MKKCAGAVIGAVAWAVVLATACPVPDGQVRPEPEDGTEEGEPLKPEKPEKPAVLFGITISQPDNGVIECDKKSAAAGAAVTLTLSPQDGDYRYREGSLTIEPELELTDRGGGVWRFTMPEEPVSITAEFEEIPAYSVTFADSVENGSFSIDGLDDEGMAKEGALITVAVMPDSGYKLADGGLYVIPPDAVVFDRVEGQWAWTFTMTDTDLELGVEFSELGPLEIYRGGARKGISVGELSDDKKFFEDCINMESEEPGRDGNRRAMVITHALNANGNAAQQSFGLFSDTEIDLENIAALSFWARANKSLNIRYAGFGDADPNRRIVYTGENYNQQIPVGVEWRRYVIPVPTKRAGQSTARVFFLNISLAKDNYVCIDDIEFIESGVSLAEIVLIGGGNALFYGATEAAKIIRGASVKLIYACDDGTNVTLQNAPNSHTLKYNLAPWLLPFISVTGGNVTFADGVITPRRGASASCALSVKIPGALCGAINVRISDGLLLDDFEDVAGAGSVPIPATPAEKTGFRWHTSGSGSVVVQREYVTAVHQEIYGGLRAGSWRPAATANKPRGGRNFDAKDASGCRTLTFRIKVTVGGGNTVLQKNTVFTFELRNGGEREKKSEGVFYGPEFTYDTDNPDGWQEMIIPLADFIGLDTSAITGYAFSVVNNQGTALRIMLDDISLY